MEGCQFLVECRIEMETGEESFFDTRQELSPLPPSPPPIVPVLPWSATGQGSVRERRQRFMRSMGLECSVSPQLTGTVDSTENKKEEIVPDFGSVCSLSDENECSMLGWSTRSYEEGASDGSSLSGSSRDGGGSNVGRSFSSLSFVRRLMSHSGNLSSVPKVVERRRNGWFRRLSLKVGLPDGGWDEASTSCSDSGQIGLGRYERIKVRSHRKQSKELSALYQGQMIKAHDDAILTMKFSPDGWFLASGGEDGVVRVWNVMQSQDCRIPMDDRSCVYFKEDGKCLFARVNLENERKSKIKGVKQSSESACVVIPSKQLLSASTDKTVRLWEIGSTDCVTVFRHSNFAYENRFISGSIDGKICIWDIPMCSVVDWADVRDIITAVSYRPDGKGAVVGTITGNCRLYDASDRLLRLEMQIALNGNKKSSLKRITAFELMVASAGSKIKILNGTNVTQNYSGLRSGSSQLLATFTPDGKHIISASEDSNIYVWNHEDEYGWKQSDIVTSCEHFHSNNAAITIPWNGKTPRSSVSLASQFSAPQGDSHWCMGRGSKCSSCHPGGDSSINNYISKHAAAPVILDLS